MEIELTGIRNALIDTRVKLAYQFQKMTQLVDGKGFSCFLAVYCRQAAVLAQWMSEWNEQLRQKALERTDSGLGETLTQLSEQLRQRQQALFEDAVNVTRWLTQHAPGYQQALCDIKLPVSPGMKQLRFVAQECSKRGYYVTWLLIMTEIERLRIVHGFTFTKLCELYLGSEVLQCFSHAHYPHQNQNELFTLCENALENHMRLHTASAQSMVAQAKLAIEAYAFFIEDCYKLSIQRVVQHAKPVHK